MNRQLLEPVNVRRDLPSNCEQTVFLDPIRKGFTEIT
jgi:hypothetical protein